MSASLATPVVLERFVEAAHSAPAEPYRSLAAFRFADAELLVAREAQVQRLVRLMTMYRGVLLYGQSGTGKSSVVNAGLLPRAAREGFWPHRVRVQPREGGELVLEPIRCADEGDERFLPSAFGGRAGQRLVFGVDAFVAELRQAAQTATILLVFDQFEELVTLFPRSNEGHAMATGVLGMLVDVLRDQALRVKLLFVFREDYLASLKPLVEAQPELVHQSLRLVAPPLGAAQEIISAPFKRFPGRYDPELSPELVQRVVAQLGELGDGDELSLSELQIVCSRLWKDSDPAALLDRRGVEGLLEDHLDEAMKELPPALQEAALAVLVHMITPSGTRNVVAAPDLVQRAHLDHPQLSESTLEAAIKRMEADSGLIRRERRHDVDLYELVSEFLIPRISERRRELARERERRRARRRIMIASAIAAVAGVVLAVLAVLTVLALHSANTARREKAKATYSGLASTAQTLAPIRPDVALLIALGAYLHVPTGSSRLPALDSLMSGFEQAALSGAVGILHGHADTVTAVAFDPVAGDVLASASGDGTVRLWKAASRRPFGAPLAGAGGGVFGLAFSPDGHVLASAHEDGSVRLWDVSSHRQAGALRGFGGVVIRVAYSPDGRELAAAALTGEVKLWRASRGLPVGAPVATLSAPAVRSITFSSDSRALAAVGNDGNVRVWSASGTALMRTHLPTSLYAVAARPRSDELATGGLNGKLWLLPLSAPRRLEAMPLSRGQVQDLAFSPDGARLATAVSDESIRITDLGTASTTVLNGHTGVVTGVAFSPGARMLASASVDRTIRLWDLRPRRQFAAALAPAASFASAVAFSPDGSTLAAGVSGTARGVRVWDARSGAPVRLLATAVGGHSVAFSPDGTLVAGATQGGVVQEWNARTGAPVGGRPLYTRRGNPMYVVAFSPRRDLLAFAGADGVLELWSGPGSAPRVLRAPAHVPIYALAFSPDGKTLASGGDDRTIRLWRVADGAQIGALAGDSDAIFALAFSPKGILASGSADDTVRLWRLGPAPRELGAALTGHHGYVRSVAFSPDGRTLVSGGSDGTIRLWDVASQSELGQPLAVNASSIEGVAFARDGTLASAGADGAIRLWPGVLPPVGREGLESRICRLVGSGLTRAEWSQYAPGLPYQPLCAQPASAR